MSKSVGVCWVNCQLGTFKVPTNWINTYKKVGLSVYLGIFYLGLVIMYLSDKNQLVCGGFVFCVIIIIDRKGFSVCSHNVRREGLDKNISIFKICPNHTRVVSFLSHLNQQAAAAIHQVVSKIVQILSCLFYGLDIALYFHHLRLQGEITGKCQNNTRLRTDHFDYK